MPSLATTRKDRDMDQLALHSIGEIWKPIPGYEGLYEASSLGRIRSLGRTISHHRRKPDGSTVEIRFDVKPRILRSDPNKGYLNAKIYNAHGERFNTGVHRLVCLTFHGPCPDGHQAAHLNGDRKDNRAKNLTWATPTENARHRAWHGTTIQGIRIKTSKLTEEHVLAARILFAAGWSPARAGALFGVSNATMDRVKNGLTWKHVS